MINPMREVKHSCGSTLEPVSPEELTEAKRQWTHFRKCDHDIIVDEDCWPYYIRSCAICGKGLGAI
jgi:hypothetical protein